MAGAGSSREIVLRVVGGLMWMAAGRQERMLALSDVVRRAVDELDPLHERDTAPTYLRDLPGWVLLDGVDRLRKAHDDLLVLEEQSRAEIAQLMEHLRLARSLAVLDVLGARCRQSLEEMRLAERSTLVHDRLQPGTSKELRRVVREMAVEEQLVERERAKLVLVADVEVTAHAC